jgi:hypothetical protein
MRKYKVVLFILIFLILCNIVESFEDSTEKNIPRKYVNGYIDENGKVTIVSDISISYGFSEGLIPCWRNKNGFKNGYMNKKGEVIIDLKFDMAYNFSDGLAKVEINDKLGYIDKRGVLQIKSEFITAQPFKEDHAIVSKLENKMGFIFINKKGEVITKRGYGQVHDFSEGLAAVNFGGRFVKKWGFINKKGETVIYPRFDRAFNFQEGLSCVNIGGYYVDPYDEGHSEFIKGRRFYIDKNGKTVIKLKRKIKKAFSFSDGLALVRTKKKWGFINKNGKFAIKPRFIDARSFSEGLAAVKINNKWGFIDKTGNIIIEPTFDFIRYFSEGFAAVQVGDKWGYIDKKGKYLAKPRFHIAYDFSEGLAVVTMFIDPK